MKKIDTVIFDFDGVLFDTEEINYQANEQTFSEFGLSFTREEYASLWIDQGLDLEDIIARFKLKTTMGYLRDKKNAFFLEKVDQLQLLPMSGISENIEKLLNNNYKIAIASSNFRHNIYYVLEKSDIKLPFKTIIGREDIVKPKPDPEVFLKCLNKIDSLPEKSIVIEDAVKGIISANRS
jgi:beta-phosphoglucomutase